VSGSRNGAGPSKVGRRFVPDRVCYDGGFWLDNLPDIHGTMGAEIRTEEFDSATDGLRRSRRIATDGIVAFETRGSVQPFGGEAPGCTVADRAIDTTAAFAQCPYGGSPVNAEDTLRAARRRDNSDACLPGAASQLIGYG